jgi:hypothetical protein
MNNKKGNSEWYTATYREYLWQALEINWLSQGREVFLYVFYQQAQYPHYGYQSSPLSDPEW